MAKLDLIAFEIAGERYAFNIADVREVVEVLPIMPVPETAKYIMGVVNLRGEILPAIDTGLRLGFPDSRIGENSKLIIVETADNKAALLVEHLPRVIHTDSESIETDMTIIESKVPPEYIAGVHEKEFLVILRPDVIMIGGGK